jgi:hypothetical protein
MAIRLSVLPTGTATFLLTDVEVSTAAWRRALEEIPPAIARHDVRAASEPPGERAPLGW